MTDTGAPVFDVDEPLGRWTYSLPDGVPLPAGWVDVEVGRVLFRFDRAQLDRLVLVRVDAPTGMSHPDEAQIEVASAVLGPSVQSWLRGHHESAPQARPRDEPVEALCRLALATAVRGDGAAWDVELHWLRRTGAMRKLLPDVEPPSGKDVAAWIGAPADLIVAMEPGLVDPEQTTDVAVAAAIAAGANGCDAERFGSVPEALHHWGACHVHWSSAVELAAQRPSTLLTTDALIANRDAAGALDVAARIASGAAGPLLLTEHRARLGPTSGLVALVDDGLVRIDSGPAGPAGVTTLRTAELELAVDTAEPSRIVDVLVTEDAVRARGVADIADLDFDRLHAVFASEVRAAVVARDAEVLSEAAISTNDYRLVAGAHYELALRFVELGERESAGSYGRSADQLVNALGGPWPALSGLRAELDGLLGPLGAFRGEAPEALKERALVPLFRGGMRRNGPQVDGKAEVFADVSDRLGLPVGEHVPFDVLAGPLVRVRLAANPPEAIAIHLSAFRGRRRLGESTCRVLGPTLVTFPVLGVPEKLFVDVAAADPAEGRRCARAAIAAELTDRGQVAADAWDRSAASYLAANEADRAALALARRLALTPGPAPTNDRADEVIERLERVALLGSSWALNRSRVNSPPPRRWQDLQWP